MPPQAEGPPVSPEARMYSSAALSLPFMAPSQAQKHVTFNEALRRLDLVTQLAVTARDLDTPPVAPEEAARYIVGAAPTGDWAGHAREIAEFESGGWRFTPPASGWRAWVVAEARLLVWDGAAWQDLEPELQNLPGIGINATSDATNRLALAAPATLFTHEGAGHQLKINKAAAGDTASLLFQTNWSGRAEMGTAGSDAFALKVSPDGASWTDALVIDPATGHVSGAAVQATPGDATPGRLMRADWGYGPGTLLGTVAFAAGAPSGAVFEQGAAHLRLASGLQLAWTTLTLTRIDGAHLGATWSFPAAFSAAPWVSGTLDPGSAGGLSPGLDALGPVLVTPGSGADCAVSLYRQAGQIDFGSGDSCAVRLMALGRWD
ncbi:DUF2793 domain-containing protein [Roseivivax sp. GX 12232]|uniref:DUF2793 domain-containing protein n=1 Tax=Roseivivax sp. GX 12232 TaxID=2900547 RepID=UPI001E2B92E6|nr:DUF2793 domain-containing protein [Roseivivax sp. GX 12232]MCE0506209.1 DUF2793 domain-containing protein [Roseivivax sp. GX 12232]